MGFRIKQLFKMLSQHIIFPFLYFINRFRPVDKDMVVLADAHHDQCPPHMHELRDRLATGPYKLVEYYTNLSAVGAWTGFRHMAAFMKLYARAGCVVICDNFLPVASCKKRRGTKVVQLWHGCGALKKFGYDAADDIPQGYHGNVYRNYDLVTVSGEKCVPFFESAMGMCDEMGKRVVKPVGVSHTDRLFDREYIESCRDRFRYLYPDAVGKKVILWAPTFRGNAGKATLQGEQYIDALLHEAECCGDIYVIKSLHPHLMADKSSAVQMQTDELMVCADVLITDYSSVFFEYLLLDRPIIFFAPDYRQYVTKRGFYLDYETLPGYVITGERCTGEADLFIQKELCDAVSTALAGDAYADARAWYRDIYMGGCDGTATDRILGYILDGTGGLSPGESGNAAYYMRERT